MKYPSSEKTLETFFDERVQAFIRYLDFPGYEPTLVFIAGWGLAATAGYPRIIVEPGLYGRHAILVDLFGCGYSDRPENFSYSIEEHAASLSGLLDAIGSQQFILIGHSLGGAVAIELAANRPDLVIQIILAEANLEAGGGPLSSSIAKQSEHDFIDTGFWELLEKRRSAAAEGDRIASIALGMWQVASPLALYRSAVSVVKGTQPMMWDQLIRMSIPRTYIFGSRSLEDYEEDRELYTRLEAHGIWVDIVPAAGHGMMAENPKGFAESILRAFMSAGRGGHNQIQL